MFLREQADDFLRAYQVLQKDFKGQVDRLANPAAASPTEHALELGSSMGPAIVCLSFSVELHVKYLHYAVNGTTPRGHNILELFRSLPEAVRLDLFGHQAIARYGWSFTDFEAAISQISNGFEKWRYAHESTSLRYESSFALALISAARFSADSALFGRSR